MAGISDIRKGSVIKHNNDLYVVGDFKFVNPGKGSAFTRTKMKSLTTGKGVEITYKSSEVVELVQVQRQNMQYLYQNGAFFSFMNQDSYETVDVAADVVGDDAKYLKEGMVVIMVMYQNNPVAMQLPIKVTYKVEQAPPAVKGDTAGGNVTKEVVLENGLKIQVPIFIKEGEEIIINTETGEYGGRVSE